MHIYLFSGHHIIPNISFPISSGAGKDHIIMKFTDWMCDNYPKINIEILQLSQPLKDIYNISCDILPELKFHKRRFLVDTGVLLYDIDPTIFVDKLIKTIANDSQSESIIYCVSGIRWLHEIDMIRKHYGANKVTTIRIKRESAQATPNISDYLAVNEHNMGNIDDSRFDVILHNDNGEDFDEIFKLLISKYKERN